MKTFFISDTRTLPDDKPPGYKTKNKKKKKKSKRAPSRGALYVVKLGKNYGAIT